MRQANCAWDLTRPFPVGAWCLSAKMDLSSFNGTAAGLAVIGAKKRLRVIRWAVGGGSLSAQTTPGAIVSNPDFKSSPPLWLRIESKRAVLSGSFSRDNKSYIKYPDGSSPLRVGSGVRMAFTLHPWVGQALKFCLWRGSITFALSVQNFR